MRIMDSGGRMLASVRMARRSHSHATIVFARQLFGLATVLLLAACWDGHGGGATAYSVAGSVGGLSSTGLVLQNNGGSDLSVAANAASFQFATHIVAGGSYNVTVAAQPVGLTCTVTNGSGSDLQTVVTNVRIACSQITHTIAGVITGLTTDGLVLQNNDADDLAVPANATAFQFGNSVAAGGGYRVDALSQPTGLTCSVSNGLGSNVHADISGIQVTCSATALSIGGSIVGLTGSGLVMMNNGVDQLNVAASSTSFEFSGQVAYGAVYAVTVLLQPTGQFCTVAQGTAVATANVATVALTCADTINYTITPSSGANGSIAPSTARVINSGDGQGFIATADAGYAVDQWLADGVLVQTGGDMYTFYSVSSDHALAVTFAQATLSPSVSSLALAVNDTGLNAALTGTPRHITITNTGSIAATNVSIAYPSWPAATAASSNCSSALAAAASCTITITPGSAATSGCVTGIAPNGILTVSADNAADSQVDVAVVGYGCIYQGGYIFSVDDTMADTGSIGGTVAALTDQAPAYPDGIFWSSDGGSGYDANAILGIDEASTASAPSPEPAPYYPPYPPGTPASVGCNGSTDGACNTANILSYYNFNRRLGGSAPTPLTQYAAGLCSAAISGYSDWYLPAICETGSIADSCGSMPPDAQDMQSKLVSTGVVPLAGYYWTSTEAQIFPRYYAWVQLFDSSGGSHQDNTGKSFRFGVRCARVLSH